MPVSSDRAGARAHFPRRSIGRIRSYNRPPVPGGVNHSILRLIDANANRAREALRVLEDYARFIANRKDLSESLKSIRHDLTAATRDVLADAIFCRDTDN